MNDGSPPDTDERLARLEYAVFGIEGRGGLLDELRGVKDWLRRAVFAMITSSVTFAGGVVLLLVTGVAGPN